MLSKTLISIDPGVSSAYAVFEYDDNTAAKLVSVDQFPGGAEALIKWIPKVVEAHPGSTIICEDFTARSNSTFSYRTKDLEPLVCIGALVALGFIDRADRSRMRAPTLQYFAGSGPKRVQLQHRWLKETGKGLYVTGKDFGTPNADDARSAISHGLAWFRAEKHIPTLKEYFKGE